MANSRAGISHDCRNRSKKVSIPWISRVEPVFQHVLAKLIENPLWSFLACRQPWDHSTDARCSFSYHSEYSFLETFVSTYTSFRVICGHSKEKLVFFSLISVPVLFEYWMGSLMSTSISFFILVEREKYSTRRAFGKLRPPFVIDNQGALSHTIFRLIVVVSRKKIILLRLIHLR